MSTYQKFYSKFQRKISSYLKNFLPEEAPKEKSTKNISLYESFDFLKGSSGLQKLHLPFKDYMDGYLGEHFFAGFFRVVLFSQVKEKINREKSPAETQSMKIQVKLGEILFWKNVIKKLSKT